MRSEASPRRGKKYYAVKAGRKTGIFLTWDACEEQVKGYPGAKFKGFPSRADAEAWLGETTGPKESAPAEDAWEKAEDTDYVVYTDGSCLKNPDGPGGWAAVIVDSSTGEREELYGGSPSTTNNRMELSAAIAALSHVSEGKSISLYTDSQYMKNAFTRNWIRNWKRNGWKTIKGTDVLNKDLWLQLDELCAKHKVEFRWVKGHAGISYNERCDQLARGEAMRQGMGR